MNFLDTIQNLFFSLADGLKKRLISPIGGSFLISWVLVNWKVIYYFMFENASVTNKIGHIEVFYSDIWNLLYIPLLLAVGYNIFYPALSQISTATWLITEKKSMAYAGRWISEFSPINKEDAENLTRLLKEQGNKHEEELSQKDKIIESLKKLNVAQSNEISLAEDLSKFNKLDELETPADRLEDWMLDEKGRLSVGVGFLLSKKGDHLLKESISSELGLTRDNPRHEKEVELATAILINIAKSAPNPYKLIPIRAGNTSYQVVDIDDMALKLSAWGVIDKCKEYSISNDTVPIYELTDSGHTYLSNIIRED